MSLTFMKIAKDDFGNPWIFYRDSSIDDGMDGISIKQLELLANENSAWRALHAAAKIKYEEAESNNFCGVQKISDLDKVDIMATRQAPLIKMISHRNKESFCKRVFRLINKSFTNSFN